MNINRAGYEVEHETEPLYYATKYEGDSSKAGNSAKIDILN